MIGVCQHCGQNFTFEGGEKIAPKKYCSHECRLARAFVKRQTCRKLYKRKRLEPADADGVLSVIRADFECAGCGYEMFGRVMPGRCFKCGSSTFQRISKTAATGVERAAQALRRITEDARGIVEMVRRRLNKREAGQLASIARRIEDAAGDAQGMIILAADVRLQRAIRKRERGGGR